MFGRLPLIVTGWNILKFVHAWKRLSAHRFLQDSLKCSVQSSLCHSFVKIWEMTDERQQVKKETEKWEATLYAGNEFYIQLVRSVYKVSVNVSTTWCAPGDSGFSCCVDLLPVFAEGITDILTISLWNVTSFRLAVLVTYIKIRFFRNS